MNYEIFADSPHVPKSVKLAKLAFQIKEMAIHLGLNLPVELNPFIEKYEIDGYGGDGYSFEIELMRLACDWTPEQIAKWLPILTSGMCRAEMRALMKEKLIK